jgi:hypothetical protein
VDGLIFTCFFSILLDVDQLVHGAGIFSFLLFSLLPPF